MDIYTRTVATLMNSPLVESWPEMQTALTRTASKKPRDWRLPVLACEAVGGRHEQAIPAAAAIACLQISIILIDDMLDADPRGEYNRIGAPSAANLASGFQAAGLEAIARGEAKPATKLAALQNLNQMMLTTALGQHMDVQNPEDEATYWDLVRTKSSPFFGAAMHVGALLGGATIETAEQVKRLGHIYGEMIQIHDDLNDTMAIPANPDWTLGRSPLPILYAQVVEHPDRERFIEVHQAIPDPEALTEAQTILIRCGAVSYAVDQLLRRCQVAREILAATSLIHREGLEVLLDDVVDPVKKLFASIGVPQPDALLLAPIPVS